MQACETLRVTVPHLQSLTDLYFDNMTAISLFHRPSFGSKIQGIKDQASLTALLASMFSFSVRFFLDVESTTNAQDMPSSKQFHQMALDQIDEILKGMEEDAPPLVVLQAMTLCGYNQLIGGVHGKGWRLVGSCVRIAYELRLHLIDYEAPIFTSDDAGYTHKWVAKEEQRRCWWAIWEMDVFASTVRRSPLAIDWTMNETYLPVDDELWFKNQHCQSCFLDPQPGERWKKLNKSGNKSPSAWLIVLSSIMRDAQSLSRGNLQGVRSEDNGTDQVAELQQYFRNVFRKKSPAADEQQPSFLGHALRSTVSTLPESLAYKGEALSFGSDDITPEPSSFKRPRGFWDAARYSIFLTIQLARFQIFHHYAFSEIASGTLFTENPVDPPFGWTVTRSSLQGSMRNCEGLRNCLEAADDIHAILTNVPEEHVKWVNPFLSSTVWLAASLQVLRKVYSLGTDTENESKFALLRLTCQRYQAFWAPSPSLIEAPESVVKVNQEILIWE
ncbi:unnamed protein product [Clonostachys rosea f. rosea IK726]|uniref:Uncharacterized protein n=1 Tax=Clonostachys rosea f. rosea IK726 TaxID=1349383 RepID=A0ACA9UQT7_BIOOC|nr:unnamed protein product [Clonostachys rosea f. rosea IK726]